MQVCDVWLSQVLMGQYLVVYNDASHKAYKVFLVFVHLSFAIKRVFKPSKSMQSVSNAHQLIGLRLADLKHIGDEVIGHYRMVGLVRFKDCVKET